MDGSSGIRWDDEQPTTPTLTRAAAAPASAPAGVAWDDQQPAQKPTLQRATADQGTRVSDYVKAPIAGLIEGAGGIVSGAGSLARMETPPAEFPGEPDWMKPVTHGISTAANLPGRGLQWAGEKISGLGQKIEGTESQAAQQAQAQPIVEGQLLHPSTWKLGPGATPEGVALKGLNVVGSFAPMFVGSEVAGASKLAQAAKYAPEAVEAIRAGDLASAAPEVQQAAASVLKRAGRAKTVAGAGVGGLQMAEGSGQAEQQRILAMPDAELQQVPAYQQAIANGMTPDQARAAVAQHAHDAAFAATLPLAVGAGGLSTLPLLERSQGVLARAVGKSRLARGAAGAAMEAPVQGAAFTGMQAASTAATNAATGEQRNPLEDSLGTFGSGAVMGGLFGAAGSLHRAGPYPEAKPGSLSDAANTLHRAAAEASAQPSESQSNSETIQGTPPTPPWIDPQTGETRVPGVNEVIAAAHGLLDQKADAAASGKNLKFAPKDVADAWGLPLDRFRALMKVAAGERRKGVTTSDALARVAQVPRDEPAVPEAAAGEETPQGALSLEDAGAAQDARMADAINQTGEALDRVSAARKRADELRAERATTQEEPNREQSVEPQQPETPAAPGGTGRAEPEAEQQPVRRPEASEGATAEGAAGAEAGTAAAVETPAAAKPVPSEATKEATNAQEVPGNEAEVPARRTEPPAGGAEGGEDLQRGAAAESAASDEGTRPAPVAGEAEPAEVKPPAEAAGEPPAPEAPERGEAASEPEQAPAQAPASAAGEPKAPSAPESEPAVPAEAAAEVPSSSSEKPGIVAETTPKSAENQTTAPESVETSAKESAAHPENPLPEPTSGQHEAGNFKSGHVNLHGMDVTIQVPKGGVRRGTTAAGEPWEREASAHYGHIRGTKGADGEQMDVYLGPHAEDPDAKVFVVDQNKPGADQFDEHKAMIGFADGREARAAYDANFPKDVKTFGGITQMTVDGFKDWLKNADLTKPARATSEAEVPRAQRVQAQFEANKAAIQQHGFKAGDRVSFRNGVGRVVEGTIAKGDKSGMVRDMGIFTVEHPGREGMTATSSVGARHLTKVASEPAAAKTARESAARPEKRGGAEKPAAKAKVETAGKIEDIGEKIGGARKDTAISSGGRQRLKPAEEDTRPTWAKRYRISEITKSTDAKENGRWVIHDLRQTRGGFPRVATRETFASKDEAEKALPLLALARNHGVTYRGDGNYGIYRKVTDRKRVVLKDGFPTPEAAKRFMATHARELLEQKTSVGEEALPKPETVNRQGPPRRKGDVQPEEFRDTFGFRGVEFGNWNNQTERQEVMNHAFDGLHDLAELLKIPPKAISLNGELGLAFGARGHGLTGARAHYERDRVVMNLTKMQGAGALAHEWFHALDHYLSREGGTTSKEWKTLPDGTRVLKASGDATRDMASYSADKANALREELRQAYATLIGTMQRTATTFVRDTAKIEKFVGHTRAELETRLARLRDYLAKETQFGSKHKRNPASPEQLAEFDAIAERLVNGENLELEMRANKAAPGRRLAGSYRRTNDDLERLSAILKAVRGHSGFTADGRSVMNEIGNLMTRYRTRLMEAADARAKPEAATTKPTSFRMEAVKADQGRGTNYWSTRHEMAARAFSAYIEDKLAAEKRSSDFLSFGSDERFVLPIPEFPHPFPGGEERAAIDKAFDTFFATVKHEETEGGGVRLFSKSEPEPRRLRTLGLPESVTEPVSRFRNDQPLKRDPDYKAAKAGDADAAIRLVQRLAGPMVEQARARFGEDAIYVAPHAEEATGKNAIPAALAEAMASATHGTAPDDMVQTNQVHHTGADVMQRLIARPQFDGEVKPGGRYVLVDDVTTSGGTFADLADYIRSKGGEVVGAVSLVNAARGGKLAPEPHVVRRLEGRHGDVIREQFGIEPRALTAGEANYLTGFRSADEIRNRAAKAARERSARLRAKGLQGLASRADTEVIDNAPPGAGRFAAGSTSRDQIQKLVDAATATWGDNQPRVRVVDDAEGLPASAKAQRGYETAEGYYDPKTGTGYVVASNLRSPERALPVLAHEAVGHYGVENVVDDAFGAGAWQKIEDGIQRLDKEGKPSDTMRSVLQETHRRYPDADPRTFAKEFLAVSAEKGIRNAFLDRVVAAIRKFLRKIMPSLTISERELRALLGRADRFVRESTPYRDRVAQKAALAFSSKPDTFYSALRESVEAGKGAPKKADAAAWKQWLDGAQRRGEFKGAEREWMGLDQWLDEQKGPVTRAELIDHVRQNQVRVQEVMHRDEVPIDEAAGIHENDDGTFELVDHEGAVGESTKFGEYTLPGGNNYRELLLTLPDQGTNDRLAQRWFKKPYAELTASERGFVIREAKTEPPAAEFRSGHFDEPNILAHVRMDDRTGPDGEKILHVEEVQSDWHQEGRKRGYNTKATRESVAEALYAKPYAALDEHEQNAVDLEMDARNQGTGGATGVGGGPVPDAPFKKEWPMLAMKRVLRYAAEHGYDKVTWTTGDQQAARYDLSKNIDKLIYMPDKQGGLLFAYGKDGNQVLRRGDVPPEKLADYVGKEGAQKLMDAPSDTREPGVKTLQGADLKLGGEGMRAFYDKMLPNELSKYLKKWGGKVGETALRVPADGKIEKQPVHSIDITPAMREGVMQGQPMFSRPDTREPADPSREPRKTVDDIADVLKQGDPEGVREKAKSWLRGKFEDFRPAMLGALQTRHLLELMEDAAPLKGYADQYKRSMQQMDADRQQLMAGAPDAKEHPEDMLKKGAVTIAQELRTFAYGKGLGTLRGRVRPEAQRLFDIMHAATIQRMDPDKAYERLTIENAHGDAVPWTHEEVKARLKLLRELAMQRGGDSPAERERITDEKKYLQNIARMERIRERNWPKLQADWQALPEEAKQLYRQVRDWYSQYRDETEKALIRNIEALDMPETYRQSLVNRMRLRFEEARREGVYFPLNRDGDFWISFRDREGNEGFKMFESAREFAAGEKRLRAAGFQIDAKGRRDHNLKAKDAPSGTFVRQVIDILQQAHVGEQVQDEVYQTFLRSLPELSMRKHAIHRKNIAGFSEDALRAFAKNGYHGAHQLARLRHAQDMQFALEAMKIGMDNWRRGENATDAQAEPGGLQVAKADALVGEMQKRHDWIMHPTDQRLANMVNSIGFIYYLGASPASALTNLTQIAQTVLPVLGAEHGWGKAARVLGAAWRDAARTVGHMDRTLTDPDERRAFLVMQQRGDFSKTQSHTLAGLAEGNVLQTSPAWSRTMNAVSWMFHTAEVINREATGMAAFRLARSKGMDFNKAIEYAGETNANTNFDYSAANRPRFMQGNVQRIALQFKNYSVGMTWLMYRNLYQAMKGETPEVRRVALRTVTGIMGMTAILAGATGLPVYNAVKMTANAANTLFGDDNEPWNFDDAFHRWLADNLGPDAARLIAEGPTNYLTGANVASRTSLANLWIRDDDQRLEGADAYHALLESLAGPIGGITQNFYVGAEDVRRGNVERGVERMLPSAVKNSIKALRYAHEGVNSLRGDPIVPDVSAPEDFLQAIGFQPAKVADQYRINTAMKNYTGEIQDRRNNLLNAYALAVKGGDSGDRAQALAKIRAFNAAQPQVAITPKVIRASLRQRARLSSMAQNGVVLSRRLAVQAREYAGVQAQ